MFTENRDDILSPEEKVSAMLDEASKEIEKLEDMIKNLSADKGYSLAFTPPGAKAGQTLPNKEKYIEFCRNEQERIKVTAKTQTSKLIENVSPELKQKISVQIDKWQNPDYKEKWEEKDISQSQDYLLRQKGRSTLRKEIETKSDITPSQPAKKEDADALMPAWLSTSLSDRLAKNPGKEPEKDHNLPEIEPDKE